MNIINSRRLRDYPRLMFITTWTILALNIILRNGWLGGLGQIIGSDFITLYGAGLSYLRNFSHLYDLKTQATFQQVLILPTELPGVNPYISPPYVAAFYSLFTHLPLPRSLILWTVLMLIFTMVAVHFLVKLLPKSLKSNLGYWQVLIIILSFFPFVEGLQVGQNHAISLLLMTFIVICMLSEKWVLAGSMAGLLIYKPQLVLGLLIIWLIWRKYKALAAFAFVAIAWAGSILVLNGSSLYLSYLGVSQDLPLLPFLPGFPGYLLLTFFGLLSTIFPIESLPIIRLLSTFFSGVFIFGLAWLAFTYRKKSILSRTPVIVLAILFPLVATPYALLHDLVILIPGIVLWARYSSSRYLLYALIVIYLGGFILPLLAALSKIALVSILTIGLVIAIFLWMYIRNKDALWRAH